MNPAAKIYRLFVVFLILVGLAAVLPRLAAGRGNDLAAGATAAVTFLGIAAVATSLAVVLLVRTLRARSSLPMGARVAGLLPLPLVVAGGVFLVVLIRHQRARNPPDSPPATTRPVTAPQPP